MALMYGKDIEILESFTGKPLMSPAPWHTNKGGFGRSNAGRISGAPWRSNNKTTTSLPTGGNLERAIHVGAVYEPPRHGK